MFDLYTFSYTTEEILFQRKEVARRLLSCSPNIKEPIITRISSSDIALLFNLYDEIFLRHQFANEYRGKMKFSLSSRLSKSAGKTICPKNIAQLKPDEVMIEIRMGTHFIFKYDEIEGEKSVGGIVTSSNLEGLQLVFEHELCHVIEFINFHTSNCKQKRFKTLAKNLFGHTQSTHQLPTSRQIAEAKYGLKIGDTVSFSFENQKLEGIIYRINKRATVMVKDKEGNYADKQGNHYVKYYVPMSGITKLRH